MKRNLFCLLFALFGLSSVLPAQWSEGNFKSNHETILPAGAFVAGKDGGGKPYYITKVVLDGNTYITKIGEGWTFVVVPRGNSFAYIGVSGAKYNPFPVYCGDMAWARAGDGSIPANAVVEPTTNGNVYIAQVSLESRTTGIGWLRVGQTEAEYIEKGVVRRASRFNLLTHAAGASDVQSNPSRQQPDRGAPPEDKRVVVDPRSTRPGGNASRGNTETGGISLVFVQENSLAVNPRQTNVLVTLRNEETGAVLKNMLRETPGRGEMPFRDLAPGRYTATIEASYVENNGIQESWTSPVRLNVSPNPLSFTIRPGVVSMERVLVSNPK